MPIAPLDGAAPGAVFGPTAVKLDNTGNVIGGLDNTKPFAGLTLSTSKLFDTSPVVPLGSVNLGSLIEIANWIFPE